MSNVETLLKEQLAEINRENMEACEREVKTIVKGLLAKQAKIKELTEEIVNDKQRLKALNVPDSVSIELPNVGRELPSLEHMHKRYAAGVELQLEADAPTAAYEATRDVSGDDEIGIAYTKELK